MTTIGETLRRERQRRRLTLDQVARELKIPAKFLNAIEEENFQLLPAGVFAKSFARQYAHFLGLDEDEIANEVQRALAPSPAAPPIAAAPIAAAVPPDLKPAPLAALHASRLETWERLRDEGRFSWSSPLPALALVVFAMLGCSLVYSWWQRARHPVTTAFVSATFSQQPPAPGPGAPPLAPPPADPVLAAPALPETVPSPQPVDIPRQPAVSTPTDPPPDLPTTLSAPAAVSPPPRRARGPVRVEVTAAEPVWVLAHTDGKYSFSGTIEANETRTIEAANTVMLRLGNAGAVTITLNGKPIGAVGPRGQVRTLQLTSGGFQIVAPKPSAPAADPI